MLNEFIKYRSHLPKNLIVYSLLGGENYDSDGIVPESSVHAAKYVFQKQVKSFTEMTITGMEANHSDLPQNKQVVEIIKQYLLNKNQQEGPLKKRNQQKKSKTEKVKKDE